MYGIEEHFPSDMILFKDISIIKLPPAQHIKISNQEQTQHYEQMGVYDQKTHDLFNKSREDVITTIQHEFYKRDQQFMATLKKYMTYQRCHLSSHYTKMMTASFAASHPRVVPATLQLFKALVRYTLLSDVQQTANLQ